MLKTGWEYLGSKISRSGWVYLEKASLRRPSSPYILFLGAWILKINSILSPFLQPWYLYSQNIDTTTPKSMCLKIFTIFWRTHLTQWTHLERWWTHDEHKMNTSYNLCSCILTLLYLCSLLPLCRKLFSCKCFGVSLG